jgi:PAS domain S-box-containing protein
MAKHQPSFLRRLIRPIPIPVLAALIGILAGLGAWIVIDRIQSRALSEIFAEALDDQLHQRAREALIRFDHFRQTYRAMTRLLANHRRMADYLDPVIWFPDEIEPPLVYEGDHPPSWLAEPSAWYRTIRPSHVLLVDSQGKIREEYRLRGTPVPQALLREAGLYLAESQQSAYLTKLDAQPYLITSHPVEDSSYNIMGSLVLLLPVDGDFLSASQQRVQSTDALVAILDADGDRVLSSSDTASLPVGSGLDQVRHRYQVTAQSFIEYDDSDLNMLFATLVPRAGIEATGARVLKLERRQRLIGAAIIIAVFVLLFVLVSSRLNQLLKRVSQFSRRALDFEQAELRRGNQLLILEDWIRQFIAMVLKTREQMRVRHEREMAESKALRAGLMETSLDSVIIIDQWGRIIEFNPTAELTFGYDRADVIGESLQTKLLVADSQAGFQKQLDQSPALLRQLTDPERSELWALHRDGHRFPVELAIKPMQLQDRLLFTVYMQDISERRRQAAEISSLAAFASESPIPVLRINQPGVVIYANGASDPLLRHWGCRRLQTLPFYWKDLVRETLDSAKTREIELRTDDGVFSLLLAPIKELGYVNIYARDITRTRRAEEEARLRQNELIHVSRLSTMGEMATGIAHELNQPLSAIVNYAKGCIRRIKTRSGDEHDLLDALEHISAQANRAGEIIKRLRGMVSRQQPVREVADLNRLIVEVCDMVHHETRRLQVSIERRLGAHPLYVRVDPVQIEQAILNLVRNALDALQDIPVQERRLVVISGALENDRVYVAVQDYGAGIRPQVMERLFDPFFSTKADGMGMGLAITQTIVDQHNGKIRADSWPGKGTIVTIELPAAVAAVDSVAS